MTCGATSAQTEGLAGGEYAANKRRLVPEVVTFEELHTLIT